MNMEKLYSRQELDEIMFEYIKQTAKEMKIEISKKKIILHYMYKLKYTEEAIQSLKVFIDSLKIVLLSW